MDRSEFARTVRTFLPAYLSAQEYREVIKQLEDYPHIRDIYWVTGSSHSPDQVLQGDAWSGVTVRDVETGATKKVRAIIISNSCDIDPDNKGRPFRRISVVPLIKLSKFERLLLEHYTEGSVRDKLEGIRNQKHSDILYFPPPEGVAEERIAVLDDVHSMSIEGFNSEKNELDFRLNNAGFYVLLLKLSIHFTRIQESVNRSSLA